MGMRFLGVGSPLIDLLAHVDDAFLARHVPGEKGGMLMVEPGFHEEILRHCPQAPARVPGGSTGNTIFALAQLGEQVAMFGKLGRDENGDFYRRRLHELGGSTDEFVVTDAAPTGVCLAMITPDAERTMRSALGASLLLTADEAAAVDFRRYDFVYIEGYMLYSPACLPLLQGARAAGCRIGFDLASFEVVRDFRDQLPGLLREYVDVLFANADEAGELLGRDSDVDAWLEQLSAWCDIAAVKLGRRGSVIRRGGETVHVQALVVDSPVDTTAAGDLWAAGFLHGLSTGANLRRAGELGSLLSSEVVKVVGSELPTPVWQALRRRIES